MPDQPVTRQIPRQALDALAAHHCVEPDRQLARLRQLAIEIDRRERCARVVERGDALAERFLPGPANLFDLQSTLLRDGQRGQRALLGRIHRIGGGIDQPTGRRAVRIPHDLSTRGIGRLGVDAGQRQRRRVHDHAVAARVLEGHGIVAAPRRSAPRWSARHRPHRQATRAISPGASHGRRSTCPGRRWPPPP